MLQGNLSTRPFYNERLATLAIVIVAVCAALLTVFNATRLIALAGERREFNGRIERNRSEAARVRSEAASLDRNVDRPMLAGLAASTREANDLIGQRTFSWTEFFGLIEKTLPADVRLVMVSPRLEGGVFRVAMTVVARDLGDVSTFIDALAATGAFHDAAPIDQQGLDDGTYRAAIEASYVPKQARGPGQDAAGEGRTP